MLASYDKGMKLTPHNSATAERTYPTGGWCVRALSRQRGAPAFAKSVNVKVEALCFS
jgi:hypothetical protein